MNFISMLVEKLISERDIYNLSRNPEFIDFRFVGYRETALSIDLVALTAGDGLTERDIVNRRDHFFETTRMLPREFGLKPRERNPNGLLVFVFQQDVIGSLIQFIRKQTKIAHTGNGGLIVSWSIILNERQIHTHRNPVSLFPPVFSLPRLIYPSLAYLQEQLESYQSSPENLSEKPDEIIAPNVLIHTNDRDKGNYFEGAADVDGDVISADTVHKHYYYGTTEPTKNHTSEQEKKSALQSLLQDHQRNHHHLLKKWAIYALGEEPLYLLNQIEAEEQRILEIEQQLFDMEKQS